MALSRTSSYQILSIIICLFASLKSEPRVKPESKTVGIPTKLGETSVNITQFLDTMQSLTDAHFFTQQVQDHKVSGGIVSDSFLLSPDPEVSSDSIGKSNNST